MGGCLNVRRPTLNEAVQHVVDALTDKYRRECIRYWREHYGNAFAESVRVEAWKRIGKRK